jgi:uncharacterized protein (UPF0333 family)
MHKHTSFAIMAAVLLTAIVTVTLYTVNRANAQDNATSEAGSQEKNMTNANGGTAKNMTNAELQSVGPPGGEEELMAVGSCVKVGNQATC